MSLNDHARGSDPPADSGAALTESAVHQMEGFRVAHQTQVLTILFTDLVGSTDMQSRLGNRRSAEIVQQHRSILREALKPFDGREVETAGDSFLIVFAAPSEGVKFALRMQAAMRKARQATAELPGVRVGIHQGQVVVEAHEAGGKPVDVYGLQVSTAARIMSLAAGGQVLCSRAVFDDARAILTSQDFSGLGPVSWANHGPYKFKGVEDAYEVCEVGEEGASPLSAPAAGEKAWPAGRGEEELGWRPAAGVLVPGTNWRLEERLGKQAEESGSRFRGSFGEVWKAWNGELKCREVFKFCFQRERVSALKREARLLKQLQKHRHPNLVEVYDVTEGDRPPYYLEMEFVEGPSLEEWLASDPPRKQRLEVAAQVADALDTVHAAGIYHRDIKPSNVLLTHRLDGALEAKLTDFGLGVAEDKRLLQSIEMSSAEPVAGTWDYIAPELRTGGKASAQSDIYSLGLMLFQLVTGNLKSLAGPGWEEQVDSEVLRRDIARCMDRDPGKRWPRAGDLARALRSHDERLRRLELEQAHEAQRKRAKRLKAAIAVVGVFAAVTLGLGALAWVQREEARRQRDVADRQRTLAVESEQVAALQRDRAQRLFAAGKNFADFSIFQLERMIETLSGSTPARKMLVDRSLAYLEELRSHAGDDAALLRSISAAYDAVGDVQGNPTLPNLGDARGALQSYRKSLEISQRLADADPNSAQALSDLSIGLINVGDMLERMGDANGAMQYYRRGLETDRRLCDRDPNDLRAQGHMPISLERIGGAMMKMGNAKGAIESFRGSGQIRQRLLDADPNNAPWLRGLSIHLNLMGDALVQTSDVRGALESYRKGLAIAQRLADASPANAQAQRDLATSFDCIGDVLAQTGNVKGALESYSRSQSIARRLADGDPANAQAQRDLSVSFEKVGNMLAQTNDLQGALASYRKCLEIYQRLADADPTNAGAWRDLTVTLNKIADVLVRTGDGKGAMDLYRKCLDIRQRLADADPGSAEAQRDLSICHERIGNRLMQVKDANGALESYRRNLEVRQRLADADGTNAQAQSDLAIGLSKMGDVLVLKGDANGAMADYRRSMGIFQRLVDADPKDLLAKRNLSVSIQKIGDLLVKRDDVAGALESYLKGLAICRLLAKDFADAQAQRDLSVALEKVAGMQARKGDTRAALEGYRKSLEIAQRLADADQADAQAQVDLAISLCKVGDMLVRTGDFDGAMADYRTALKIAEEQARLHPTENAAQERVMEIQRLITTIRRTE